MLKKIHPILFIITVFILTLSCEEKSDPQLDEQTFSKVYDNSEFSGSTIPLDLQQTEDGGYIIVSESKIGNPNFRGIYLMKADKYGNFVKGQQLDSAYVNPIVRLTEVDNNYYFFCMQADTTATLLAKVNANVDDVQITPLSNDLSYPAVSSADNENFVLLSYDNANKQSIVSTIDPSGNIQNSKGYDIGAGDGVEEPLINHFIHTGKQLPFQVGKVSGGSYYFNGYYNYSFSLCFVNLSQDTPIGVVQGQQDDGGFSALISLGGTKFAASRFNFGDNYLLPNVTLNTTGISSTVDLGGNTLPELVDNAKIRILQATINSKNVLIYASDTRSKQIGLYFYDEATGEFMSSRYLGFSNPYEIANLIQTDDGGLAVCGTTYLAGRFPRICLFKISKEELNKNVK